MYTFARIVTGIARIIIWLVKFALKILLIPVIIGLTLLEWICTIAVGFFGPLFDVMTACAGWSMVQYTLKKCFPFFLRCAFHNEPRLARAAGPIGAGGRRAGATGGITVRVLNSWLKKSPGLP